MKKRILISLLLAALLTACGTAVDQDLSPEEKLGAALFVRDCAACHATQPDTVIVGPSLAGVAERAAARVEGQDARSYLETSIREPGAYVNEGFEDIMPKTFGQTLTDEEVDELIAYLYTLE